METKTKKCHVCGVQFSITPKQQQKLKERNMKEPNKCSSCRAKNRQYTYKVCKVCGETFSINELEREWFAKKGLYEPERCIECREKRKKSKKLANQ